MSRPAKLSRGIIAYHAEDFARTGNPVHAWEAIRESLKNGQPLPEDITAYLSDFSTAIHVMSRNAALRPKTKWVAAIGAAFVDPSAHLTRLRRGEGIKLPGGGSANPFRLDTTEHALDLAWDFYHTRQRFADIPKPAQLAKAATRHRANCPACRNRRLTSTLEKAWALHGAQVETWAANIVEARAKSRK